MRVQAAAILGLLTLAATSARAASNYGACASESDPAACVATRAMMAPPNVGWADRIEELVRAGAAESVFSFASRVRPMADLVENTRRPTPPADLAALELSDPEAARTIRNSVKTDEEWRQQVLPRAAALQQHTLTAEAIAGYVLAAAAYRSADPFADPAFKQAAAAVKDEPMMLARAMQSLMNGAGDGPAMAPPGARAVLERASRSPQVSAASLLTQAGLAWRLGQDGPALQAMQARKALAGTDADGWRAAFRLWSVLGRPEEAQPLLDANAQGAQRLGGELKIGEAWLTRGDKAKAAETARRVLSEAGDDPGEAISAPALLAKAGAPDEAFAAAQVYVSRAEHADAASRSARFTLASQVMSALGRKPDACALAHKAAATAGQSADARVQQWKARYRGDAPFSPYLGPDFTETPTSVDDLRDAYRDAANRALARCGGAADDAQAGLSPASRLKAQAIAAQGDPAAAGRVADAALAKPEPEDPLALVLWRESLAQALAAAGRTDLARAKFQSALHGIDQMRNPEDQRAAAMVLARDWRALDTQLSAQGQVMRPAP